MAAGELDAAQLEVSEKHYEERRQEAPKPVLTITDNEAMPQPTNLDASWDGKIARLITGENLEKAIQLALGATPAEETLHIIPIYTAMLEVRSILTGRKIL